MGVVFTHIPWAALLILLPLAGGMVCFILPRRAKQTGIVTASAVVLSVTGLGSQLIDKGVSSYALGGWGAPLGIDLYADGLSLVLLMATALVGLGVSVYSTDYFQTEDAVRFWPLWMFLLAALNGLFLAADIFNVYVTLEMIGLAAVALAALPGDREALSGAMRYLLATLLGSSAYLFGIALLYHRFGSVDIAILALRVEPSSVSFAAFGLIAAGLLLKTALFPLHFWLPPAHASAPAPVSALLSALVVKTSFYIMLRLWLTIFAPFGKGVDELFGVLGGGAILWGSLMALRQSRLKLLVAYSTIAQIGYLFLAFPLAAAAGPTVWNGVLYLAISHALAKTAMFLTAGNLLHFAGHDRIEELDRVVQRLPLTASAFALAGVSIMGLPPSGGFVGKWLLLEAAVVQRRWDLAAVMLLGGLLAAGYIFKVLGHAFTEAAVSQKTGTLPARMEWAPLLLAFAAILLGFIGPFLLSLLGIGETFGTNGVRP